MNSIFVGSSSLQILPVLNSVADGDEMEMKSDPDGEWCLALCLLEKLLNQSKYEMAHYNTMKDQLYEDNVVQKVMILLDSNGG